MTRRTIRIPVRGGVEVLTERQDAPEVETIDPPPMPPADWPLGALLNVRNAGERYLVTLMPEEWDYRHQERALVFTNVAKCQDFISAWYARTWDGQRA